MLLSDGRIAKFQSRSLRRKAAPTVTSFLLGFAPFVPHCAKLRRAAMPLAQDDALIILCTDFKIGVYTFKSCLQKRRFWGAGTACRQLAATARRRNEVKPARPAKNLSIGEAFSKSSGRGEGLGEEKASFKRFLLPQGLPLYRCLYCEGERPTYFLKIRLK